MLARPAPAALRMGKAALALALALLVALTSLASADSWRFAASGESSESPVLPAPTQFEVAMMQSLKAVREGRAPDPRMRRADGTPGTLLDALLPETVTEEEREQHRRKLQKKASAWRLFGANIPFLNGPTLAALNASFYRYSSVPAAAAIDWRQTIFVTPVVAQFDCSSCWVMVAVDSVAMAYAIATNTTAVAGSVQQICDMPNATYPTCGGKTCCQGGWPEDAFAWLVSAGNITTADNYNYWSEDGRKCTLASSYPVAGFVTGWERVPLYSMSNLMKAVNMQPVMVYISASSPDFRNYSSTAPGTPDFKIYDGTCTTEVNHAMIVVGYNTSGPTDYWILKNTWPASGWGDNGYMYLVMRDGLGKCGIQTVNPLFPTYFPNAPTAATVTGGDPTPVPATGLGGRSMFNSTGGCTGVINPCGAGTCYQNGTMARCKCPEPYVEVVQLPTSKCVHWNPCTTVLFNPCGAGTCMNVGDGSYICGCPTGYAVGARVNGASTCIPVSVLGINIRSTMQYTIASGDTCARVLTAFGVSSSTFSILNPSVKCAGNSGMVQGLVVNLPVGTTAACVQQYSLRLGDTCPLISYVMATNKAWFTTNLNPTTNTNSLNPDDQPRLSRNVSALPTSGSSSYGGATTAIMALNPALNCSSLLTSQQVCVVAASSTISASPVICGSTYSTVAGDSCTSISSTYKLNSTYLRLLNPGLNCNYNSGTLTEGIQVCVAPLQTSSPMSCSQWYSVQQGDTCAQIWNAANISQFQLLYINPGLQCQPPFLYVGLQVCIDSPVLVSIADPNFLLYTVQPNDTWSTIQAQYTARCLAGSIIVKKIVLANSLCTNGTTNSSSLAFPYPFNCTSNGTRVGDWTRYNPIQGTSVVIPCAAKIGASCGCVDSLVTCGSDLMNYPSYCDARCQFCTPASGSACTACQTACQGMYGLPPDNPSVCPPNFICPMPFWAPPISDASAVFTSRPLCNYRNKTCTKVCTMFASTNGSPTAVDVDCYNLCNACHRAPCVGPSVIVDEGTTPCSTCSVAGCRPAGSGACQIDCSYWNSFWTTLNP